MDTQHLFLRSGSDTAFELDMGSWVLKRTVHLRSRHGCCPIPNGLSTKHLPVFQASLLGRVGLAHLEDPARNQRTKHQNMPLF